MLTPRGGFFDGRNQNRDPEPSAKPLRHSDKPTNLEMLFLRTGPTTIGEEKMLERKRAPRRRDGFGLSGPFGAVRKTFKETYPLTPRGGFFDGRNQNRDPEPSAKPPRNSDKPTSLEILSFVIGPSCIPDPGEPFVGIGHSWILETQRKLFTDSPRWIS